MYDRSGRRSVGTDGSRSNGATRVPGKTTLTSQWPNSAAGGPGKTTLTSQWPAQRKMEVNDAPATVGAKNDSTPSEQATETAAMPSGEAPSPGSEPGGHAAPSVGPEATGGDAESQSGSIDTISGPGLAKSAGDAADDARSDLAGSSFGDMPVELSMTTTTSSRPVSRLGEGKLDPGELIAGTTFSQPGGRTVNPFGAEFYEPAFSGTTWTLHGGACKITTTLDINCPWGTASGGRMDIKSGSDPAITADNWKDVRDDLMPSTSSPHKSSRNLFYSQPLVERHEKFHGTDDEGWTKSSGIPLAQVKAKAATIMSRTASADVTKLLTDILSMLRSENLKKWYKGGGSSHDSYAGEIRAYADGRPEYEKLAKAVEAHGKALPPTKGDFPGDPSWPVSNERTA